MKLCWNYMESIFIISYYGKFRNITTSEVNIILNARMRQKNIIFHSCVLVIIVMDQQIHIKRKIIFFCLSHITGFFVLFHFCFIRKRKIYGSDSHINIHISTSLDETHASYNHKI